LELVNSGPRVRAIVGVKLVSRYVVSSYMSDMCL